MSEKSASLFWGFAFSFCEKIFELQAKYSDRIHQAVQAVKCLHKTSHVGSKFHFKTAQVASSFSQSISVLFPDKKWAKERTKN